MLEWLITFLGWLVASPFTPFAVVGIAATIWRNAISTFLEARVRRGIGHEFDKKLEEFRADLREKGKAMDALRDGALAGMISQQTALFKRRIEAIDQLWLDITDYRSIKAMLVPTLVSMNKELLEAVAKDDKIANALFQRGIDAGMEKKVTESFKAEPFVSPMAWALASAYRTITVSFIATASVLKEGADWDKAKIIIEAESIAKLAKEVLPEHAQTIDEQGYRCYGKCLDTIEEKILNELRNMLEGKEADEKSVQRANDIRQFASEVEKTNQQQ